MTVPANSNKGKDGGGKESADSITHIGQLHPDPQNARKHNPRNIGMIVDSLHEVGAARSIVIDEDNNILAGNGTVEAAAQAGIERLRVVEADGDEIIAVRRAGLSARQKTRLALFDNRSAELATYEVLVLADLNSENEGLLDGLFREDELEALLAAVDSAGANGADANEPQRDRMLEKWQCRIGQVWAATSQDGKRVHHLICGDSGSDMVSGLIAGLKLQDCDIVLTDPPYELVASQVMATIGKYARRAVVMSGSSQAFALPNVPGWRYCADFIWRHRRPRTLPIFTQPLHYHQQVLLLLGEEEYQQLEDIFAEVGQHGEMPDALYHSYVLMLVATGAKMGWRRPRANFGSVVEVEGAEYVDMNGHGHAKSAEVFREFVRGFRWQRWCDPYLGTGATLIAVDAEKRTMLGIEYDPAMFAVCLQRLSDSGFTVSRVHPND